jgi:hypothetical protein
MRAEVKFFEWPDCDRTGVGVADVESALMVFVAGPVDEPGEGTFQITVCTPDGLRDLVRRDSVVVGRHHLFVERINPDQAEAFVRDRLRRLTAETWTELAEKIGRLGYWEFEDYTPAG